MSEPSLQVKVKVIVDNVESEVWKKVPYTYVKATVNGATGWHECQNVYVKVAENTWKPMYSYEYIEGGWGSCVDSDGKAISCGTGTQYQTVTCYRTYADGKTVAVADKFCDNVKDSNGNSLLTKPATSQSCAMGSCEECDYNVNSFYWKEESWATSGFIYKNVFSIKDGSYTDSQTTSYTTRFEETSGHEDGYFRGNGYKYRRGPEKTAKIANSDGSYGYQYYALCRTVV